MRRYRLPLLTIAAALALGAAAVGAATTLRLAPIVKDAKSLDAWELQHPDAWAVEDGALVLKTAGVPSGPIRKPAEWAILKSEPLGDFTLSLQVRCDEKETTQGRDLLLFFGYRSPTRFYYVHLSNHNSPPHNGIFIVNDADRKRLDDGKGVPSLHDKKWHRVRLVRDVATGSVAVYFGDRKDPILKTTDRTLLSGRVGVGSFDDTGAFKEIVVEGKKAAE